MASFMGTSYSCVASGCVSTEAGFSSSRGAFVVSRS
jgi:hypothetical protein